jgi:hypothetical protein
MPYIKKDAREELAWKRGATTVGELNYLITLALINHDPVQYIKDIVHGYWIHKGRSYQTVNDIIGALTSAGYEYERRTATYAHEPIGETLDWFYEDYAAPYEDEKIQENGDVY